MSKIITGEGARTITAVATDATSATCPACATTKFTVNIAAATASGSSPLASDDEASATGTLVIEGATRAGNGTRVDVRVDGNLIGQATVYDGQWGTCCQTITLACGVHAVLATIVNQAGITEIAIDDAVFRPGRASQVDQICAPRDLVQEQAEEVWFDNGFERTCLPQRREKAQKAIDEYRRVAVNTEAGLIALHGLIQPLKDEIAEFDRAQVRVAEIADALLQDRLSDLGLPTEGRASSGTGAQVSSPAAELAAIDREQAAAELQCKPAGKFTTMTGTKVEPQSVTDRGPTLTTDDVCEAFNGIGLSRTEWRQRLTKDRPDWLIKNCLARKGRRGHGGEQATWLIFSIAKALAEGAGMVAPVPAKNLDTAFRSRPLLRPWADQWELVLRDNQAWGIDRG